MSGPLLMKSKVKGAVQVIITDVIVVDMLGDPTGANKPGICKKNKLYFNFDPMQGQKLAPSPGPSPSP